MRRHGEHCECVECSGVPAIGYPANIVRPRPVVSTVSHVLIWDERQLVGGRVTYRYRCTCGAQGYGQLADLRRLHPAPTRRDAVPFEIVKGVR